MDAPTLSTTLIRAFRTVLRPLVRLMIASGITYPVLTELLKGLFVEVAVRDFRLDEAEPTDSRVNLLTGLQRRDIRRLRESRAGNDGLMLNSISFGAQLVAKWMDSAPYVDAEGRPRALARHASAGGALSFDELVASQSKDIRPRVILDEWLRLGIVRLDDDNNVVLVTEAFVPSDNSAEKLFYFAHNLHDHIAAASDNLTGKGPSRLERSVHYNELSAASIAELDEQARTLGMAMVKELNRSAAKLEVRDAGKQAQRHRFTCGVYFFAEPVDAAEP